MSGRRYVHGVGSNQHATKPGRNIPQRPAITPDFETPTYPDGDDPDHDDSDVDTTGERAPFEPPTQPPVPMPPPDPAPQPPDTVPHTTRLSSAALAERIGVPESDVITARNLGMGDVTAQALHGLNVRRALVGRPPMTATAAQHSVNADNEEERLEAKKASISLYRWSLARSVDVPHTEIMDTYRRFDGDPEKLNRYLAARLTKGPRRSLLAAGDRRWWRL